MAFKGVTNVILVFEKGRSMFHFWNCSPNQPTTYHWSVHATCNDNFDHGNDLKVVIVLFPENDPADIRAKLRESNELLVSEALVAKWGFKPLEMRTWPNLSGIHDTKRKVFLPLPNFRFLNGSSLQCSSLEKTAFGRQRDEILHPQPLVPALRVIHWRNTEPIRAVWCTQLGFEESLFMDDALNWKRPSWSHNNGEWKRRPWIFKAWRWTS